MTALPIAIWLAHYLLATPPCHARGLLPDPVCTSGAVATTDLHIICSQPTRERRRVDDATRRRVLASYGVAWEDRDKYEVDHLVPLEVFGANSVENLWAEPIDEARRKDVVENRIHRLVCTGHMKPEDAEAAFATDWTTLEAVR